MIIRHKKFTEAYFRRNKGHYNKITRRNCETHFSIWRRTYKDLKDSYKDLLCVFNEINKYKKPTKEKEKNTLRMLKRELKGFSSEIYSYKEKTTKFLNEYLNNDVINKQLKKSVENFFFSLPICVFIKLHNSGKHSGSFIISAHAFKKNNTKTFYIINFTTEQKDRWIAVHWDGGDVVYNTKRAMRYIDEIDQDIFFNMARRP